MKNIFNKTTIYSCILAFVSMLLGFVITNVSKYVSRYWSEFSEEPFPVLSNWICEHPALFPILFMLIFIVIAILALKKGKLREVAFHAMMVIIIWEMCYLGSVIVAFVMPIISVLMSKGIIG